MLGITYHPSRDPYHCAFRAICILEHDGAGEYDLPVFRMVDFYLLFPHALKAVTSLPADVRREFRRRSIHKLHEPYQSLPEPRALFRQLESVQTAAYQHIAAAGVLDPDAFRVGKVKRGAQELSDEFRGEVRAASIAATEVLEFLTDYLAAIPLYGPNGLKARTGLMEFRYDPVLA